MQVWQSKQVVSICIKEEVRDDSTCKQGYVMSEQSKVVVGSKLFITTKQRLLEMAGCIRTGWQAVCIKNGLTTDKGMSCTPLSTCKPTKSASKRCGRGADSIDARA
jgi:hypothetical protein